MTEYALSRAHLVSTPGALIKRPTSLHVGLTLIVKSAFYLDMPDVLDHSGYIPYGGSLSCK
jgi:hypothetical protein